jgi:hypothetical protein
VVTADRVQDGWAARARALRIPVPLALGLVVFLNALWIAYFGLRMHGLAIFDEKFAVEGARWLHGSIDRLYDAHSYGDRGVERLTAVLFVPALWLFHSTANQFVFDHLLMALLFSLQAIPAFLLARGLRAGTGWSLFAAALSVFGPWAIYGTVFLNNAPAACAAAFALWAMWRSVTTPAPWWDGLALLFVGLAALARVSSAILIVALPVAIVAHVIVTRQPRELLKHWLLGVVGVLGVIWLATRSLSALIGDYPTAVHPTSGLIGERALTTIAHLSAGAGFFAMVIGGAWVLRQLLRPLSPEANAFAVLALAWLLAIGYVNLASGVDERYELILFLPLVVAFAVALGRREISLVPTVGMALLVWLALHRHGDIGYVQSSDYLTWPSREWLSKVWLNKAQFNLHIGRSTALDLIGIVLVLVAVALSLLRGRRRQWLVIAVAGFAFVFALLGSAWAMKKLSNTERPDASFAGVSFVDKLTGGARTDPLGSTSETDPNIPHLWDEVQFFNASITHPISLEGKVYDLCCAPTGGDQVAVVDHKTGAITSPDMPKYVTTVPEWLPAGFATDLIFQSSTYSPTVRLERLREPARAAWLSLGFDMRGWVRPHAEASLRVFPAGAPGRPACLRATLTAPRDKTARWTIGSASGSVPAAGARRVDVPLHGTAPNHLTVRSHPLGTDPVIGQPGFIGLSDMRLVKCGMAEPPPRPAP